MRKSPSATLMNACCISPNEYEVLIFSLDEAEALRNCSDPLDRDNYLFTCSCEKCTEQIGHSDEEDEDEEEDDDWEDEN